MAARALLTVVLVAAVWAAGCAVDAQRPRLVEAPVALVAGQRLVVPIDPLGGTWADEDSPLPPLRFSDGRAVEASIVTLARTPRSSAGGWLSDAGTWSRVETRSEGNQTMLVADVPKDALGLGTWMNGVRVSSYWVLPTVESPSVNLPVGVPVTPEQEGEAIELLEVELADPQLRWRATRALERLGIDPPARPFQDPVVEAWAQRCTTLSAAAERRLHLADPLLAERWVSVLTRWIVTPDGVLPVWPTRATELWGAILAMLRPGASDVAVIGAARSFLERQPTWLAWVADDAGSVVGGSIAVVNLSANPALLSVRAPGGPWIAHGMLAPDAMTIVPAPAASVGNAAAGLWEVRLGGRTTVLPVATEALTLTPPGRTIGPFWHDWTLAGLRSGEGRSPAPGSTGWVGGLLHQDPRLSAPSRGSSGWAVYVEVLRPPCDLPDARMPTEVADVVRVAFGPTDTPRVELTVRCTGVTTVDTLGTQAIAGEPALLTTSADRWAFTLPIHESWMEPDGSILIGIQSTLRDGVRATWPRPLLPGQQGFGRVRIDPSSWGLSEPSATARWPAAARP